MMTSFTLAGPIGLDAISVSIQCTIDATKPASFHVEGASTVQTKEICVRVRSALLATGLCAWPTGRVVVALDTKGAKLLGPALDLPIALAIAGIDTAGLLVAGELGLDGSVRAVRGAFQAALLAKTIGLRGVLVSAANARAATDALEGSGVAVHAISHLAQIEHALAVPAVAAPAASRPRAVPDFADVRGQSKAIEAAARSVLSREGLLLSGAPGTGKTMVARRIPGILPQMRMPDQVEVTRVYSALGLSDGLVSERPFRAPHHTISAAALAGGGTSPRPGEVHLAAHGVLFLDEIAEFSHAAIEALALALAQMPAASRPLVVAASNPCPCGYRDSGVRACGCTAETASRYAARVQWAADKLGLTIRAEVQPISLADQRGPAGEASAVIAGRISAALAGN